jgi:hypothetical protein
MLSSIIGHLNVHHELSIDYHKRYCFLLKITYLKIAYRLNLFFFT